MLFSRHMCSVTKEEWILGMAANNLCHRKLSLIIGMQEKNNAKLRVCCDGFGGKKILGNQSNR